jgi:formylglycine-generating enzyme required for sulfatase activity
MNEQVQGLASTGQVLVTVGVAGTRRTDVIDLPTLKSSGAFFGLVGEQDPLFPPPPGMVKIPAGTFVMGKPPTEKTRQSDELQHTVTLTKDFYMSRYEVTQGEYLAVMGENPSYFNGAQVQWEIVGPGLGAAPGIMRIVSFGNDPSRPVEQVTWYDATNYCGKLTAAESAAGRLQPGWVYRLPTEAEWEYACRAGTITAPQQDGEFRQ